MLKLVLCCKKRWAFLIAQPGLERDWREALGTSPDGAGQGKPELTEA
jgi:hypothetical protein